MHQMRVFMVANEMGLGGVSMVAAAAFASSSAASLPDMPFLTKYPDEDGGAFPVVQSLENMLGVRFAPQVGFY